MGCAQLPQRPHQGQWALNMAHVVASKQVNCFFPPEFLPSRITFSCSSELILRANSSRKPNSSQRPGHWLEAPYTLGKCWAAFCLPQRNGNFKMCLPDLEGHNLTSVIFLSKTWNMMAIKRKHTQIEGILQNN